MSGMIAKIDKQLSQMDFTFSQKPIVIGGMAMESHDYEKIKCGYSRTRICGRLQQFVKIIRKDSGNPNCNCERSEAIQLNNLFTQITPVKIHGAVFCFFCYDTGS